MFPFAGSCEALPKDAEFLMEAGFGVSKALRTDGGELYQVGQACEMTYRWVWLFFYHRGTELAGHLVMPSTIPTVHIGFDGPTPPS